MNKSTLLIWLLICTLNTAYGQEKGLNEGEWNKAKRGVDYFEKSEKKTDPVEEYQDGERIDFDDLPTGEKETKERERSESNSSSSHRSSNESAGLPEWLSTMLMIIVIGILLLVIVSTIMNNPSTLGNKKVKKTDFSEDDLMDIEANLFDNDLEKYIYEARNSGNIKLAIRFSYIYIIRLLSENGLIIWKKDKTNIQYFRELRSPSNKTNFSKITGLYEYIWYGDQELTERNLNNTLLYCDEEVKRYKTMKNS